jgi:hypothetical protein
MTLSKKAALVITLKAAIAGGKPIFLSLTLVELQNQDGEAIKVVIFKVLQDISFPKSYFSQTGCAWLAMVPVLC